MFFAQAELFRVQAKNEITSHLWYNNLTESEPSVLGGSFFMLLLHYLMKSFIML